MTDETTQLPWQKALGSAADQAANKPTMIGITPRDVQNEHIEAACDKLGFTDVVVSEEESLPTSVKEPSVIFKPVENVTFYSPSEKATRMINANEAKAITEGVWAGIRISFMDCPAGRSFLVSRTIEEKNLRVVVSRKAKKAERKYSVIAHPDCFEIYRHE